MTAYDASVFRTVVSRPGEQPRQFYSVNKLLVDMAAAGIITLIASVDEPGNTDAIWLDLADPEIEGGTPKAYSGASWVTLTRELFGLHITNNSPGFVTDAELDAAVAVVAAALDDHISDATAAHAATAISNTPAGNIAAMTVQAAINELDSEKSAVGHTHTASGITDFTEAVQDVIGTQLGADGGDLDWSYNDGSNTLDAAIKNDAVTYAKMQDVAASQRLLGRYSASAGVVEEITPAQTLRMLVPANGEYNIIAYGAVGDDATDNTAAIQAALDALKAAGGGTLVVPFGIFRHGPLTYDISAVAARFTSRLRIVGTGSATSVLKCIGSSGVAFQYLGNTSFQEGYLSISGLAFFGDLTAGSKGLDIDEAAYSHFSDVVVEAFETNWEVTDVDQSQWDNCSARWGVHGADIDAGSTTGPNSLVFNNFSVSNNSQTGATITNGNAVVFNGGSFQYNGSTLGNAGHYGLRLIDVGGPGYGTVNFNGTVFEGNKGIADFYHTQDTYFARVNFKGVSWYRTDSPTGRYSTNCLNVSGSSTNFEYTISGCTIFTGGSYTPSAGRPFFSITGTGFFHDDGSNYYEAGVEAPSWSGKTTLKPGGAWAGPFGPGQAWKLQGFNTGSASYVDLLTLTANNPPTLDVAAAVTFDGSTFAQQLSRRAAVISPSQITSDQNNYAPTGIDTATVVRLTSDTARNISGLQVSSPNNRVITLVNANASDSITLLAQSASSTDVNRFALSVDIIIRANSAITLWYDPTTTRWRPMSYHETQDLKALENLATTGYPRRTGDNTWTMDDAAAAGTFLAPAWTSYSPTPTFEAGSGTLSCSGAYFKFGKKVVWRGLLTVTSVGTGTGYIQITLPGSTTTVGDLTALAIEWANGADAKMLLAAASSSFVRVYTVGGFGGGHANGDVIPFTITYECA